MAYADRRVTPLWLSHHYPEDYDRCVRIGRSRVCRRCLALYPLTVVVLLIGLWLGPAATDESRLGVVALLLAPIPAVVEFVLEHLGIIRYQPVRQIVLTLLLALGLGVGFARYLRHPGDLLFWGVVAVYSVVCLAAALSGRRDPTRVQPTGTGSTAGELPSDDA